jgi:pimeloyl-ACP methyl ester carboxylesterase
MSTAQINGLAIEYEVHGTGEPLLLVMGLAGQMVGWPRELVDRFVAEGFQVILFDNRDIGLSSKFDAPVPSNARVVLSWLLPRWARSPYLLSDMADDAAGLLDHLGIEQAHVLGASMGGMISQCLAIGHPSRVASLTSIMSNTGDHRHGKAKFSLLLKLARAALRTDVDPLGSAVAVSQLISGPGFDLSAERAVAEEALSRSTDTAGTLRQTLAIAASPDRTEGLRRLDVPTLVVHGLLDRLVDPSGGIATARAVPGARLLMYPDMAHDLPRNRWDEVVREVVENTRRAVPIPVTA